MTELAGSRSLLEVYYVGEVGTGLGPTLEFYTLLSRAFQEEQHGMWRAGKTVQVSFYSLVNIDIMYIDFK